MNTEIEQLIDKFQWAVREEADDLENCHRVIKEEIAPARAALIAAIQVLIAENDRCAVEIKAFETELADERAGRPLLAAATDKINDLEQALATITYAAHMPEDYQYDLPSWINQNLYACWVGAKVSANLMMLIESGRLTFPNSPAGKRIAELEAELAQMREAEEATCVWKQDKDDGSWDSTCGLKWDFTDEGPEENECYFCPQCGKKIAILPQPPEPAQPDDEVEK